MTNEAMAKLLGVASIHFVEGMPEGKLVLHHPGPRTFPRIKVASITSERTEEGKIAVHFNLETQELR